MPSGSVATEAVAEILVVTPDKSFRQERGEEDDGSGNAAASSAIQAQMAADVAELRAIMMAAAKHFKIDMPRPDSKPVPSQPSVDLESIQPRDESYDEETTIQRHIAFLPSDDTLRSKTHWKQRLGLESPAARAYIRPRNWSVSASGLHPIMDWSLSGHESATKYDSISKNVTEFGYTMDGHPCKLGTKWDQARTSGWTSALFQDHTVTMNQDDYTRRKLN
jgi:hypothetical protein